MNNPSAPKRLLVIGGADGIGMWLVKRVFSSPPEVTHITLVDRKPLYRGHFEGATNPDSKHIDELASIAKPIDTIRLGDAGEIVDRNVVQTAVAAVTTALDYSDYSLVMLAVPEEQIETVAARLLPRLQPGTAVFDVTSTKTRAMAAMERHAPDGVSILGLHPLFGPAVPDAIGQTFVMVPTERTDRTFYAWLMQLLRSQGAIIEETTAITHDHYMLLVQTLTHYAYLVFGKALAKASQSDYNFDESFRFSTPPYNILMAFTARIIGGNPRLYTRIQKQPGADELRQIFVTAASELAEQFAINEAETLIAIESIVEPFRGGDVARAYADSITLVDSVQQNYRDLFRRMEQHQLTIVEVRDPFEQRAASRLHVGIVVDVAGNNVAIEKHQIRMEDKWYLAYDEESAQVLKKAGKNPRREIIRIMRRNIRRVFTSEETRQWRVDNLRHHQRDLAVLVDENVDMEHICDMLVQVNDALVSGKVQPAEDAQWLQRYGMHNKLLKMTIFGDRDPQACVLHLLKSLRLFGIKTQH